MKASIIKAISLGLCIATCSCIPRTGKIKPLQESLAKHDRVSFKSWDGKLKGSDCDMILHFEKDSKVVLEYRSVGINHYKGTYQMGHGQIWAKFDELDVPWPIMWLETDGEDFLLHRIDGYTSWLPPYHPDAQKPHSTGFWPFRAELENDTQ